MDSESRPPPSVVKCSKCGGSCSSSINSSSGGAWLRSVKRKHDEFEKGNRFFVPGFEIFNIARVQIETECAALRDTVSNQQHSIQNLQAELEEERNAASSAANEAMSMILRLQREKAEVQMEATQYKRFAEEKTAHDQQELSSMEDLLYKREQTIQSLTCEVQAYKHRILSYGVGESDGDGETSQNPSTQGDAPIYDYPPLKCNSFDADNNNVNNNDTPRDHLKNLEYMMSGKKLSGKFSMDSVIIKETASDIAAESPSCSNSIRKGDGEGEEDKASDRICTIDSIHTEFNQNGGVGICQDYMNNNPNEEFDGSDVKKLFLRLQALEADRESMRQAIVSMRTDKAQLALLKEIAQQLCKDTAPEKHMSAERLSVITNFSFSPVLEWVASIVFWRKKAHKRKYFHGLSAKNMGLSMLLDDDSPQLRCLASTQVYNPISPQTCENQHMI